MRCKDERVIDEGGGGVKVRVSLGRGGGGGGGGYAGPIYLQQLFFSDTSHLRNKSNRLMSHFVNYSLIL